MTNSRQKGKRGELEFAHFLTANGFPARRGQQYAGGGDSPDVVSDLPVHWEVKRTERLRLYRAMQQAVADKDPSTIPVVAHRQNGEDWVAIVRMEDFLNFFREMRDEQET